LFDFVSVGARPNDNNSYASRAATVQVLKRREFDSQTILSAARYGGGQIRYRTWWGVSPV